MVSEPISWTFYGYLTPNGGREVQDWFANLLEEEKDGARDTLGYLQAEPPHLWRKPEFSLLGDGLSEIRFRVSSLNRTYRIYGCFWPIGMRHSYTLLLGADKKVGNPRHDIAEARKRKRRLESEEVSVHEFEF
jgi:hypothetical protein